MVRCLARAGKVGRQQGNLRPGREALPRTRRTLSTKNMVALPLGNAGLVKQDLRAREYRNPKERERLEKPHPVGGLKHLDRKEARAGTDE